MTVRPGNGARRPALAVAVSAAAVAVWCIGLAARAADHAHESTIGEQAEHAAAETEHVTHEEPTAMAHVNDDPSGKWEFFEHVGPTWLRQVRLPRLFGFQITKFMVLELIAAILVAVLYIPLATRMYSGEVPRGLWWNMCESVLTFLREDIAKPAIGEHDADTHVPFLWTLFLFILINNLLGLLPFGASATASIYVTGALALCVFFAIHGSAIAKMGFGHYLQSMWPHIDVPYGLGYLLKPLIFVIEWVGVLVRNMVLAVRLFANMFAGHMVLATILIFIYAARNLSPGLWGTITATSVFGVVALSLLELFVAFLQAYIFTFLTALFMGMAMHPQH